MATVREGDRLTDGRQRGVVDRIAVESRRGLEGGVCCEAQVRWNDGSGTTFECVEDLEEWFDPERRDGRP